MLPDGKETQLGSSNQEASPSASKNTEKRIPTAISGGAGISEVPGCRLLQQMSSQ